MTQRVEYALYEESRTKARKELFRLIVDEIRVRIELGGEEVDPQSVAETMISWEEDVWEEFRDEVLALTSTDGDDATNETVVSELKAFLEDRYQVAK